MDHIPLIGSLLLMFTSILHTLRAIANFDLGEAIPVWVSGIMAFLLGTMLIEYVRNLDNITPNIWGLNPLYITMTMFLISFCFNIYRVFLDSSAFTLIPMWLSYTLIPFAALLCWYNLHLEIS